MSRFLRISALAALTALVWFAEGCSSSPCAGGCPEGLVCDEATTSCVTPNGSCTSDSQCSGTRPHCEPDLGICAPCVEDSHCPGGRCETSVFQCVASGCSRGSDCASTPGKPYCSADGQCVECLTSSQCLLEEGVRRTCDLGRRVCVKNPCKADADCSLDASGGRLCDTATGGCVACLADAQCTDPMHPRCLPEGKVCAECARDADCDTANGETCTPDTHVCKVTRCVSDATCDGAQKCNTETGDCYDCATDADCHFGGVCQDSKCVQPTTCANNANCLYGTFCENGACVSCRQNSDCSAGQTCSNGTCQEPSTCQTSGVCGPGRVCTDGVCAASTCTADSSEPNDLINLATPVRASSSLQLSQQLCPNETDYFSVTFPEGSKGRFSVTYPSSSQPLTLELILGPGEPPLRVVGTQERAGLISASIDAAPPGTKALIIKVSGGAGTMVGYTLGVSVTSGSTCQDDAREPDSRIDQAGQAAPGIFEGVFCGKDSDWLVFDVPERHRLAVDFRSDAGALGAAVRIQYEEGASLKVDSYQVTNGFGNANVVGTTTAPTGGRKYWVELFGRNATRVTYTATIKFIPDAPTNDACTSPLLLNTQATNVAYNQGSTNSMVASCGGSGGDSFWTLKLNTPSSVKLDLSGEFESVLSLMTSCTPTDELSCAGVTGTSQTLSFEALPAGDYLVRVAGKTSADTGAYALSAQVQAAPPATAGTCAAPAALTFTNGVATVSGSIALAANNITSSCGRTGGDVAFDLTLPQDQKVQAKLTGFPGASLSLVPVANCAAGTGFCSAVDSTKVALLERNAVSAGSYRLVVDGGGAVAGSFTLEVKLLEPIYPPDNDICGSEEELPGGTVTGDTRGANDDFAPACGVPSGAAGDAVYAITVTGPDEQVTLELTANFDAALVVTEAACGTGDVLACESGSRARVVLPALAAGVYYVWIDGYENGIGTYSLKTTRMPAPPPPTNELCSNASTVDLSQGAVSVIGSTLRATGDVNPAACQPAGTTRPLQLTGSDVVYAVSIPASKTLRAVLNPTDFDGALYVMDDCAANTCVAGSDSSLQSGGSEQVEVSNTIASDRLVYVVVDSWQPKAKGNFSLVLSLH